MSSVYLKNIRRNLNQHENRFASAISLTASQAMRMPLLSYSALAFLNRPNLLTIQQIINAMGKEAHDATQKFSPTPRHTWCRPVRSRIP